MKEKELALMGFLHRYCLATLLLRSAEDDRMVKRSELEGEPQAGASIDTPKAAEGGLSVFADCGPGSNPPSVPISER